MAESVVSETATDQRQSAALQDLFNIVSPIRTQLIVVATITVVASMLRFAPSVAIAQLAIQYSDVGTIEPSYVVRWLVAAGAGLIVGHFLIMWGVGYCHKLEAKFRYQLRRRVAHKLSEVPLGWYDTHSSGSLKRLVRDDIAAVHTIIAHAPVDVVTAIALPIISLAYLFFYNWLYALGIVLFIVLLMAGGLVVMSISAKGINAEYLSAQSRMSHLLVELTDGIATVKNFGGTNLLMNRFDSALRQLASITTRWMNGTGRSQSVIAAFLNPVGMLLPVTGLGWLIITYTSAEPVILVPFLMVGLGLPMGLLNSVVLIRFIGTGLEALNRINDLLAVEPLSRAKHPKAIPAGDLTVEMRDVSVSYVPGHPVLKDINLHFAPGTVTAIVGPSGSGKTTLTRLIARYIDVDSGAVLIGGVDVRELAERELLAQLAIVDQDVALMRDTVAANISLGNPDAAIEEVIDAARSAQIHQRIQRLPEGYDAVVGAATTQLSGGEQQRLTLARALLRDSPIVLLDEATAYVDPHSEREIQQALSALTRNRTVIVIAHRLASIVGVDNIVVLDRGRVVEQGTHQELMALGGVYQELWEAQQ